MNSLSKILKFVKALYPQYDYKINITNKSYPELIITLKHSNNKVIIYENRGDKNFYDVLLIMPSTSLMIYPDISKDDLLDKIKENFFEVCF